MAPTVTRLILSFALVVAVPVTYAVVFIGLMEAAFGRNVEIALVIANVVVGCGFAVGWVLIWMREIRWANHRVVLTLLSFLGSVVASLAVGVFFAFLLHEKQLGALFGGMIFGVLWLFSTAFVWKETRGERRQRLSGLGVNAVACPACGYNLTGLQTTQCPECGARYTLDQLVAACVEQVEGLPRN